MGCDPEVIDPAAHPAFEKFVAIWDTGATASVISQGVVDRCGLKPTGMTLVHGVQGPSEAEVFMVNLRLPQGVAFANVRVTKGNLGGAQALIGMDIITAGDFSITNMGGRTVFSFRVPSITTVDYVKEYGEIRTPWGVRAPQSNRGKKGRKKR